MDRTCTKCGREFNKPHKLRRHLQRKTPCEQDKRFRCERCGKGFASRSSRSHHHARCGVEAQTAEGALAQAMRKLDAGSQNEILAAVRAALEKSSAANNVTVQNIYVGGQHIGQAHQNTQNIAQAQQCINGQYRDDARRIPFNRPRAEGGPIEVSLEQVRELFIGEGADPRLKEFLASGEKRMDLDFAVPFVAVALAGVVKAAHRDPAQQNICLNPARADQVKVWSERVSADAETAVWECMSLREAVRRLYDEVSHQIDRRVALQPSAADQAALHGSASPPRDEREKWRRLDLQDAVCAIPLTWKFRQADCVAESRPELAAHLEQQKSSCAALDGLEATGFARKRPTPQPHLNLAERKKHTFYFRPE
jgi:DNA-directed RNA polymerase subunit RPC12/RpoP